MRIIAFLMIVLLMACSAALAQEQVPKQTLWAKQFPATDLNLDVRYSTELKRLYIQVDTQVAKTAIDNFALNGFFLPRDARIVGLWINGKPSRILFVGKLQPGNFNPAITSADLLSDNSPARYHVMALNGYAEYPDMVKVNLSYYLDMPDFQPNSLNQMYTLLKPDKFWYPRNINVPTNVKIKVVTTTYMRLMLGDALVPFTDKDYMREHVASFRDDPAEPLSFRLTRE